MRQARVCQIHIKIVRYFTSLYYVARVFLTYQEINSAALSLETANIFWLLSARETSIEPPPSLPVRYEKTFHVKRIQKVLTRDFCVCFAAFILEPGWLLKCSLL